MERRRLQVASQEVIGINKNGGASAPCKNRGQNMDLWLENILREDEEEKAKAYLEEKHLQEGEE